MSKTEFMNDLSQKLDKLTQADREEYMSFFSELIAFSRTVKIPANEVKTRLIAGIVSCRCLQKRLIYAKNRTQELYHFLSPNMAFHSTFDTIFIKVDERQQKHPSFSF